VDYTYLGPIRERVKLAMKLDKEIHSLRKKTTSGKWVAEAAEDMEIDMDDDLIEDEDLQYERKRDKDRIQIEKAELSALLKKPLVVTTGKEKLQAAITASSLPAHSEAILPSFLLREGYRGSASKANQPKRPKRPKKR